MKLSPFRQYTTINTEISQKLRGFNAGKTVSFYFFTLNFFLMKNKKVPLNLKRLPEIQIYEQVLLQ